MLMTWQLWMLYLLPLAFALLLGLFTGCYWEQYDDVRNGDEDSGQSA